MRKMLLSMLALGILWGTASLCPAQTDLKPLVTVSFSGYDKLMTNIGVIGQLGGNPSLNMGLEMMLKMMTQGKGLAGLDTKQPWGMVVLPDGQSFAFYGFLPVTDLKQLMDVAGSTPQLGVPIKLDGDVYEIQTANGPSIYVKQNGKWAILTNKSEQLAKAPTDPLKLLGDLPKRYDLAVRLSVRNVPKDFRDQVLTFVRAGAEVGSPQMPNESDEDYAFRVNATRQAVEKLTTLANEADDVLVGWNLDPSTKTTYLDFEMTAQTGTKLADQFAQMQPGKTNFAGLLVPGAAVTANWTRTLADADVAEAKNGLAMLRKSLVKGLQSQKLSEAEMKLASQLLSDVIDVVEKTVETKKTDGGLMVLLDPAAVTLVAGATITNGAKLEKTLKQLVEKMQQEDAKVAKSIKLNAETHEGVRLSTLTLPTPDEKLVPMVGNTLEVVLGIADDKLLVTAGRGAVAAIKKAIDQSKTSAGKEVPPLRMTLAATPIAKFIAQIADDDQVTAIAERFVEALPKTGGKDHVVVTSQPIPQGFRLRLEIEEGLLKAIASMGPTMGPMPPPGAMPPGRMPPR